MTAGQNPTGTISGTIYDGNGNGSTGETVYVYSNYNTDSSVVGAIVDGDEQSFFVESTTTNSEGKYSFTDLFITLGIPITFAVYHTLTTYIDMSSAPHTSNELVGDVSLDWATTTYTGMDWHPSGTISGTIYDGNGNISKQETIYVYSNYDTVNFVVGAKIVDGDTESGTGVINEDEQSFFITSTTTDSYGEYSFTDLIILELPITFVVYHTLTTYIGMDSNPHTSKDLVGDVTLDWDTTTDTDMDWHP